MREERKLFGSSGSFSPQQRGDIQRALGRLENAGLKCTLWDAVDFWIRHNKPSAGRVSLPRLLADLKADRSKKVKRRSPVYLDSLDEVLGPFVSKFEKTPLAEITSETICDWISNRTRRDGGPLSDVTKAGLYRYLHLFFQFGVKRGNAPSNPVDGVDNDWAENTPRPGVLSVAQAGRLVEAAYDDWQVRKAPDIWAYVLLSLYCGLRRAELLRMTVYSLRPDWRLEVSESESKTRGWRTVTLPFNVRIMLQEVWEEWGDAAEIEDLPDRTARLIYPVNFRKRLRDVAHAAKIQPWVHNGLRHSFATYYYAVTENKRELLNRMGHDTDAMTFEHYLRPVRDPNPERYFLQFPDKEFRYAWEAQLRECGGDAKKALCLA